VAGLVVAIAIVSKFLSEADSEIQGNDLVDPHATRSEQCYYKHLALECHIKTGLPVSISGSFDTIGHLSGERTWWTDQRQSLER